MGKVVKGARVAQEAYVLKPPVISPAGGRSTPVVPDWNEDEFAAAALAFDDVELAPVSAVRAEPEIDWNALRAQASALIDEASADAEALVRDAHQRATALVTDAQARAAEIEEAARKSGFDRGVSDGRAGAEAEMEEMLATMRGLVEMARVERHKVIQGAEPEIVRLSTAIAEKILHQHVQVDGNTVVEMARNAITRLVNRETVTVRVNPADIETMREHRERLMTLNDIEHLRVIEDQRVDRGGVLIETDAGTIDAKISTQLREARRLLAVDERIAVPPADAALLNPPAQAS